MEAINTERTAALGLDMWKVCQVAFRLAEKDVQGLPYYVQRLQRVDLVAGAGGAPKHLKYIFCKAAGEAGRLEDDPGEVLTEQLDGEDEHHARQQNVLRGGGGRKRRRR